ncbi:MAG TPA: type II toxin-antitoxin system VapC family toxin [Solirubrobacteraceae bacterium]|nr:type II toxin-antitoxin system VapC family toxin [Solirubrobacteraceae bacterium]
MAKSREQVLVDSDVIIDHIRGVQPLPTFPLAYSVITRCELFAGRDDRKRLREILGPLREIQIDAEIAERGGELKRDWGVATPDALIAATAIVHGLSLMTRNVRHFERVPGLVLFAPGADPTASAEDSDSDTAGGATEPAPPA